MNRNEESKGVSQLQLVPQLRQVRTIWRRGVGAAAAAAAAELSPEAISCAAQVGKKRISNVTRPRAQEAALG
jgi:hypothetical protein